MSIKTKDLTLALSSMLTSWPSILGGVIGGGAALMGAPLATAAAIGAGVFALGRPVLKAHYGGGSLRPAVFLECEPLSRLIKGGTYSLIIPSLLKSLQKMDTATARQLRDYLKTILFYEEHFSLSGLTNPELIARSKEKICALKPGESLALPCNVKIFNGHSMVAIIERIGDKFSVTIHNGGSGIRYHYIKGLKCQTAFRLDDVELSNLLPFVDDLVALRAVSSKATINRFYETILPALKGNIAPASEDPRVWAKPQTGGSCTGYSLKCLIRSVLTKEEHAEFKARFLSQTIQNMEDGVHSFRLWENTPYHRMVLKVLKLKARKYPERFFSKEARSSMRRPTSSEGIAMTFDRFLPIDHRPQNFYRRAFFHLNPKIRHSFLGLLRCESVTAKDRENPSVRAKEIRVINKLMKRLQGLYSRIDSIYFTESEKRILDTAFSEIVSIKNKAIINYRYTTALYSAVECFAAACAPHFITQSRHPLFEAIDLIQRSEFTAAKEVLTQNYENLQVKKGELLLLIGVFKSLICSHFPENSRALECFAALESILDQMCQKNSGYTAFEHHSPLDKSFVEMLFGLRMQDQIKGSVWEEALCKEHEKILQNKHAFDKAIPMPLVK